MKIHNLIFVFAGLCVLASCRKDNKTGSCNYDHITLYFADQIHGYNPDGTPDYITTNDTGSSNSWFGSSYVKNNYDNGKISQNYRQLNSGAYFSNTTFHWDADSCTRYFTQEGFTDTIVSTFQVNELGYIISSSWASFYYNINGDIDSIVSTIPSYNLMTKFTYSGDKLVRAEEIITSGENTGQTYSLNEFFYNDKNQWVKLNITLPGSSTFHQITYTYNKKDQLSLIEYDDKSYDVKQKGCGDIINLEPKNLYRFSYLSVPVLGDKW